MRPQCHINQWAAEAEEEREACFRDEVSMVSEKLGKSTASSKRDSKDSPMVSIPEALNPAARSPTPSITYTDTVAMTAIPALGS